MSALAAAEKHPVWTVAVFFATLAALLALAGWNQWVAFAVAVAIGLSMARVYAKDLSKPYRTLDCQDGRHGSCAQCWCECHALEAAHLGEVA